MSNIKIRVSSGATDFEKELNKKKECIRLFIRFQSKAILLHQKETQLG